MWASSAALSAAAISAPETPSPSANRSATSTALRLRGSVISDQIRRQQAQAKSRNLRSLVFPSRKSNITWGSSQTSQSASVIHFALYLGQPCRIKIMAPWPSAPPGHRRAAERPTRRPQEPLQQPAGGLEGRTNPFSVQHAAVRLMGLLLAVCPSS